MVGCGWPGFAELRLGRGVVRVFEGAGGFFVCSWSRVVSVAIRCLLIFECCISIYFFEINDVINDVSTFISYPCRIFAVMFIVWPS